ncbi:MAG: hypothetical protein JNM75_10485 [Rhodospirillales bacterium]|nr:hypothetical protein [Rhodospirillales bacterium]
MKKIIVAAALVLACLAPAVAANAQTSGTTAKQTQQQKLSALDPGVRQEVSARMAKGEKFDDVIELLILNEAAAQYPDAKFYRVVPPAHTVLVAMPDNTMRSVAYDPATLQLKP